MSELTDNTLQAELMLSQAEVLRLAEMNTLLAERLAAAEAESRKHQQALLDSMNGEEGHYRLYVRYRDQRDKALDDLATALNQVEVEEDARILAEERLLHGVREAWDEGVDAAVGNQPPAVATAIKAYNPYRVKP